MTAKACSDLARESDRPALSQFLIKFLGGPPIGDKGAFELVRMPTIEHWVKLAHTGKVVWSNNEEPFMDWKAIESCVRTKR